MDFRGIDSVQGMWDDFKLKCLKNTSEDQVGRYMSVFYAAYEACLLTILSAPARHGADAEGVVAEMTAMVSECRDYFEAIAERAGKSYGEGG